MQTVRLTEDDFYNFKLMTVVQYAIKEITGCGYPALVEFYDNALFDHHEYSYKVVGFSTDRAYNLAEMTRWMYEGDVVDAVETLHNVYKNKHGIRPRFGTPEEWKDLKWLKSQLADLCE